MKTRYSTLEILALETQGPDVVIRASEISLSPPTTPIRVVTVRS